MPSLKKIDRTSAPTAQPRRTKKHAALRRIWTINPMFVKAPGTCDSLALLHRNATGVCQDIDDIGAVDLVQAFHWQALNRAKKL